MRASIGVTAVLGLLVPLLPLSAAADEALLASACGGCHAETAAGLSRISEQRKTPEGWLMTIVRMRIAHGLEISNADQAALVTWLSETQGLAPAETEGWRYALEKDPNVVEAVAEPLGTMCGRCHTNARVAMQRRTAEEWLLHMDFHVGQFPTIEYQASARDRDWYEIAKTEIAPLLAERYPLETEAWTAWQAAEKPAAAGDWTVLVEMPEKGAAYGTLTVTGDASPYAVSGQLSFADGSTAPVEGSMNLYTGYEWRANLSVGGEPYRQVLAISPDGARIEGRQFQRGNDSIGGHLAGVRADGAPAILGTVPENAAAGEATVQLVGAGLTGVEVAGATAGSVTPNAHGAAVTLSSAGNSSVTLSAAGGSATFAFYDSVDRIAVEPAFTIARVGGGSDVGPDVVPAHFKAVAFWNGPDGEAGTDDDVRVGAVPAAWSLAGADETADQMEDARFAGAIGSDGVFTPAVAGPNPERPFSTNNAGSLTVTANALGQSADAHLIVTVQRFIDPPIR
jgi:quinohemoprotein amine dehydrogenase